MATTRIFRLTDAGLRALQSPASGLPATYRRVLAQVSTAARADEIFVEGQSQKQVLEWLDQLDTLCFVAVERIECVQTPPPPRPRRISQIFSS